MSASWRVFRVFGIDIRVHVTFIFIVAYFAVVWGVLQKPGGWFAALYGVLLVILLFAFVVVHELTHARVAMHYGVGVKRIVLLPIGGMAQMDSIPEEPRTEFTISIAGPLSNLVLGLIMFAISLTFVDYGSLTLNGFYDLLLSITPTGLFLYLMTINLTLAVFNLLPAFPMDGGRVFRALLAMRMGRARATRVAVVVGQMLAVLLGIWGILSGGIFMILVAAFIFFGASAEGSGDMARGILGDVRVRHALYRGIDVVRVDQTIGVPAARIFHTYQEDFPVVDEDGSIAGMLTRDRLITSLSQHGASFPVAEAMRTDFPVATLDEPLSNAFNRMRSSGVKAIPVMEGGRSGRLLGMVSMEDISEVYSLLQAGGPDLLKRVPSDLSKIPPLGSCEPTSGDGPEA
jgi:Zn-dependent protease